MKSENENLSNDDLIYELNITLEAMLIYAGVRRDKLQAAAQAYIENIDAVLDGSDAQGADEPIAVVEFLRANKPELFN